MTKYNTATQKYLSFVFFFLFFKKILKNVLKLLWIYLKILRNFIEKNAGWGTGNHRKYNIVGTNQKQMFPLLRGTSFFTASGSRRKQNLKICGAECGANLPHIRKKGYIFM